MTEILRHLQRASEKNPCGEERIVKNSYDVIATDI